MLIKRLDTGYEMIANAYLLLDEESGEAAIVDPGLFTGEVEKAAQEYKIKYILLTHGHFDHILGAYALKQATGATVAVHTLDAPCLYDAKKSLADGVDRRITQQEMNADLLFNDGDSLNIGKNEIKIMHTPGHTQGSVCFIIESERTIITGDTLFCMTVGRSDFEGSSPEALAESVRRLVALEGDYRVLPGHNRETTLDGERHRNRYIRHLFREGNAF